jgi:phosphatidate phosphatase APP1
MSSDGAFWTVSVRGWIFESEADDPIRNLIYDELIDAFDLDPDEALANLVRSRVALFLVDSESGKRIAARIVDREFVLPKTDRTGHISDKLEIAATAAAEHARGDRLRFRAVTPSGDRRTFSGVVHLIGPVGVSVISDIDDTVKATDVRDKKKALANTFLRPFRAAEGMAETYRAWAKDGAVFHYVSSSPWQLYPPLSDFLAEEGFPDGTFHLRIYAPQIASLLDAMAGPLAGKPAQIEPLLRAYPRRKFILVGDSGEKDPEVYGELARKFGRQIAAIYIRDVTGDSATSGRYRKVFHDLPRGLWRIFDDPAELRDAVTRIRAEAE